MMTPGYQAIWLISAILDEHAVRIRGLVAVARHSIIEIGRELIEAKAECGQVNVEWVKNWLNLRQETNTLDQ